MSDRPFVHLHCHTHYSLLDGANRIPELADHVKAQGMNAVAMTDHGNLYGAIEFHRECTARGLNPIVGYEAYVAPGKRTEREARRRGDAGYHLTLLAKNLTGFKNLIKMSSAAFLEGYHYVPRIDKELLEAYHEGLICLSGCASSEFSEYILKDQLDEAVRIARWFHQLFGKDFYVEIQNNGLDIQRQCAEGAVAVANKLDLPLVATCDAHYLTKDDAPAHDVLLCINTGKTRSDENRMRYGSDQFYVRPPAEMYRLFPGHEEAVKRSQEIANGVEIKLDFKKRHFPVYLPPAGKTPEQYLRELCAEGVRFRYGDNPSKAVRDRLEHELGIICRMGFASYFLIVSDFVRYAVEHGIPASARGSACGAIVSYVLQLSHVDPLDYDLLFERFLDPNRSEAPDIDIDFCQDRREQVIAYVKEKYGEGSVAQIATFGTLAARAAIKDVGRALNIPLERVTQLTNMVPKVLNITLEDALKQSPELKAAYDGDADIHELIDIAMKLEGTNRNTGTHAAGVVIANGPITDYVPVQRVIRKGEDGARSGEAVVTTQWVMGDIEKVGLLKMDFLGLRTLTLLDNCVRLIKQTRGITVDVQKLPLDDPETYALLQRGDARGVFQFESDGIRELLKRLKPDNIRDIIACTALYRPGPLEGGMVDEYVDCKHGRRKPNYPHPVMEEVLSETFNVMVYQEQVMRILNRLGGIELSSAYACIKAISKKKMDIIDQRRVDFVKGAQERGLTKDKADEIFSLIVLFGGYAFNKSHSAAYAHVSYQTAYLKAHFTPEFMAALLSSEIDDGNKRDILVQHIDDAKRLGVDVLPPSVNRSESEFAVKDGNILFGLTAIKGCGRGAAEEVARVRNQDGLYRDLFDLCERVDLKVVSKTALEKLIKAGALDCLHGHRAQLMHALPRAIQAADERQADLKIGQRSLFDVGAEQATATERATETLPDVPLWSETEKLKYEKEVLDFYLTSHPLAQYDRELRRYAIHDTLQLKGLPADYAITMGGMLTMVRLRNSKRGRFAAFKLEDLHGSAECVVWSDSLARLPAGAVEDQGIRIVQGSVKRDRDEPLLVLTRVLTLEQAAREMCKELWLRLQLGLHRPSVIDVVGEILRRTPGPCPVKVEVRDRSGRRCVLKLGREFNVNAALVQQDELERVLGEGGVKLA
jgi:DNA polymerase-3 subunit alpha